MLTPEQVRAAFNYDPETGILMRLSSGKVAGCKDSEGYLVAKAGARPCKTYKVHRLVWMYVKGKMPLGQIDHINRNKADNRIENLREANASENKQNMVDAPSGNKSKLLGVRVTSGGRFRADIRMPCGPKKYLGTFPTAELAHEFYCLAKAMIHPFSPEATT